MANERITIEKLQEYHGLIAQDANILKRSTAYILNQVVNKGKIYLQCTQAGTTASTALDLSNVDLDDTLTDGTVIWKVVSITGAGFGNSTGAGLEDWESNHDYAVDDIYVYEGEIYKTLIAFTSGATEDSRTKVNNIVPSVWAANTAYTAGDIIEHTDVTTLKKVYYDVTANFTSGATFEVTAEMDELQITEEYVPNPLTKQQVKNLINNFVPSGSGTDPIFYNDSPIGTIIAYMGITAPRDYLACDGQTYNIVDYKELAEYIKVQFGSYNYFGGDGTTTFAVPDLRGEFLRGTGTNSHTNSGNGASVGTHQTGTLIPRLGVDPSYTQLYFANVGGTSVTSYSVYNEDLNRSLTVLNKNYNGTENTNGYVKFTGTYIQDINGEALYATRPTNTSVLYCIKYNTSVLSTPENNYSTEEQRIGTWIDGKPLYQITLNGIMPDITAYGVEVWDNVDLTNLNISKMISMSGFVEQIQYGTDAYTMEMVGRITATAIDNTKNVDCVSISYNRINHNVVIISSARWANSAPYYITIKYTKTTD